MLAYYTCPTNLMLCLPSLFDVVFPNLFDVVYLHANDNIHNIGKGWKAMSPLSITYELSRVVEYKMHLQMQSKLKTCYR